MTIGLITGAVLLALGLVSAVEAQAQGLQPGMRTMIQQGGIEPGPLLGAILPGEGYAPGFGFAPRYEQYDRYAGPFDGPRWGRHRGVSHEVRPAHRRHRKARRTHRHHFAR